jgi:hypothetical protein
MKKHTIRAFARRMPVILAIGSFAMAAQAAAVKAPPRPPGSERVQVEAGLSPDEVGRQKRAHKHSKLEKKDHTRDDSLDVLPEPKPGNPKPPKPPKSNGK